MCALSLVNFHFMQAQSRQNMAKAGRLPSLLLLLVSSLVCVVPTANAENNVILKREVGPLLSAPGQYFDILDKSRKQQLRDAQLADMKQMLGGEEAYRTLAESLQSSDADHLAEELMRAFDGLVSAIASRQFLSGFLQGSGQSMPHALNEIHLKDGRSMKIPLHTAITYHSWYLQAIERQLAMQQSPVRLSGNYAMTASGGCAIEDGYVDLLQDGHYFEGWRGNALLLWGSIGMKNVYMQLAESKYAVVRGPKEKSSLHFPDKPSALYKAGINDAILRFRAAQRSPCTVVLMRK